MRPPKVAISGGLRFTRAKLLQSLKPLDSAEKAKYSEFAGVSTSHFEPIDPEHGGVIHLQSTGNALCQVCGPVKVGDVVGYKTTGRLMELSVMTANPDTAVGTALQAIPIPDNPDDPPTIALIRVSLGTGRSDIKKYRVKQHKGDYLICRAWGGWKDENEDGVMDEDPNGVDVLVAKPRDIRYSLTSETVDGVVLTYSDWDEARQFRKATDGTNTDDEVIVPRYLTQGRFPTIIKATTVEGGTDVVVDNVTLTLEQIPCGRAWSRKYVAPSP